jgi:hypothetical protein
MPSIKDLLEMMSTSWPVALGLLFASSGILLADYFALSYLASLPKWLPGAAFIVAICSASVLAVSVARAVLEMACVPFARRRRLKRQAEHIAGIEDISEPEKWLLAWAIANQTQVFSGDFFNEHVKALMARGYIRVPAGPHLTDKTPLHIPDHIWAALKERLRGEDLSKLFGARPFDRW